MTTTRLLQRILAIMLALFILGALYVAFRYWQTPSGSDIANIKSAQDIKKMAASVCTASSSGFDGAGTGVAYIAQGQTRMDVTFQQSNQIIKRHLIIDSDAKEYVWQDGSQTGVRIDANSSANVGSLTTQLKFQCTPWWLPDSSFFKPPTNIRFTDVAGV
jgi:hypothetical protein